MKRSRINYMLLWGLLLSFKVALASPTPGAGSSLLASPQYGLFFAPQGFSVQNDNPQWTLKSLVNTDLANGSRDYRFENSLNSQSFLSIKVDHLKANMTLEKYVKHWIKDYNNFGFDVLGSRPFYQNTEKAVVIDLLHKKKSKQLRQVVFLKNRRAIIFSCVDKVSSFNDNLNQCNQIIKTFSWSDSASLK